MAFVFGGNDAADKPAFGNVPRGRTPQPYSNTSGQDKARSLCDGVGGTVTFPSRPGITYRFKVTTKDDKLSIWLEDSSSKKQWETGPLELSAFVTDDLVIPHAMFNDYAKCFLNCLESLPGSEDCSHDLALHPAIPDGWVLKLTLKIRVFATVWTPTYSFGLTPVALEPVDLLAAKIRDQEDLIRELTTKLAAVEVVARKPQDAPVHAGYVLKQQTGSGRELMWTHDGTARTSRFEFGMQPNGRVRFTDAGAFVVHAVVVNNNSNNNVAFELWMNGKVVASCYDSGANGHNHSSVLYQIVSASINDELSMIYKGSGSAQPQGTLLTIHQLR